jgi:hypothetical protein
MDTRIVMPNGKTAQFRRNYKEMNALGKKKLLQVSEQFLKIWNTVHEGKKQKEKQKFYHKGV